MASKALRFKLHSYKLVTNNALMVFDLGVGYDNNGEFVGIADIRGCWLKQKNDGTGNYVSFPSKMRVARDGSAVTDDSGYKVYDNIVDLYMEKGANPAKPDTRAPTPAAWNFRKWLIDEATKVYTDARNAEAATPSAPAAVQPKPAARPMAAVTAAQDDFEDDSADDSFPF